MIEWCKAFLVSGLIATMVYFFATALVSCDESRNLHRRKVEEFKVKNSCFVSGYYGRSGEYKTYNCNGLIIKETDM